MYTLKLNAMLDDCPSDWQNFIKFLYEEASYIWEEEPVVTNRIFIHIKNKLKEFNATPMAEDATTWAEMGDIIFQDEASYLVFRLRFSSPVRSSKLE